MATIITRPQETEYAPYYHRYVTQVAGNNALEALQQQVDRIAYLFLSLTPEQAYYRYAEGKWTPKQILLHIIDCERVFSYRAMCIARGESQPLPGFDEDAYAEHYNADSRSMQSIVNEYKIGRMSTMALFSDSISDSALSHVGTANNNPVTPRASAWIVAGHELHHAHILRTKYLGLPE